MEYIVYPYIIIIYHLYHLLKLSIMYFSDAKKYSNKSSGDNFHCFSFGWWVSDSIMGCRVTMNSRVSEVKSWMVTSNNICILLCYLTFPPFSPSWNNKFKVILERKKYSAEHPQIKLGTSSQVRIQVWTSVQKTLTRHINHLTYTNAIQLWSGWLKQKSPDWS